MAQVASYLFLPDLLRERVLVQDPPDKVELASLIGLCEVAEP